MQMMMPRFRVIIEPLAGLPSQIQNGRNIKEGQEVSMANLKRHIPNRCVTSQPWPKFSFPHSEQPEVYFLPLRPAGAFIWRCN